MGCCRKTLIVGVALLAALVGYVIHGLYKVPPVPQLDQNQWWGPGKPPKTQDTTIRPFKVEFNPERITGLKTRLSESEWYTEPLEGVGFDYGFNGKYLKEVVSFWKNQYDFSERENYFNKFPQFKTNIQGLDIHFVHLKQKPVKGVRIIPLLLLHGWPGSYLEFHKMIPLLTTPSKDRDFVFNVIVPSIPGYGYSQAAAKPGLATTQIAVIMRNLMIRLGYKEKFVIQGGDWGSVITKAMAVLYPQNIYGYHTNMPVVNSGLGWAKLFLASLYPSLFVDEEHISKVYPLSNTFQKLIRESGYMHIQATKPDTVGVALKDSPVGLAAYILEKFSTWTNPEWMSLPDGGLTKKFTLTELLDNIMVYWDSRSITTSVRLYSEAFVKEHQALGIDGIPVAVPTALARFGNELMFSIKWQIKDMFLNVVQLSDLNGGHFAAFEEPTAMANDIISAVYAFDKFYKDKSQKL